MYLLNAFSVNMIENFPCSVTFNEVTNTNWLVGSDLESAVGHQDTANVFSSILGVPVPMNRTSVVLKSGDTALLGQYSGPRLPEGATTLPEGAKIKWILVDIY
jgi:hypothetical protein